MNSHFSNMDRRSFIHVGSIGAGLTLGQWLSASANDLNLDDNRSAVLVFLKGGPSHQDTFDLKPKAPEEYRGQFRPIKTNVNGMEICEHLPRLSRMADQYSIIRGITHNLADHGIGTKYLLTGNRPTPAVEYPMYGSVVSKEFPPRTDLPSFVSIDRPLEGPGYLGPEYGPLSTGEKPQYGRPFRVRGISLGRGISIQRYQSRNRLMRDLNEFYDGLEKQDDQVRGLDRFEKKAFEIISSPRSRKAFDVAAESEKEHERFGKHEFGQSLLMTSRLIEAGVRFVTVILEDWDTHQNNFSLLGSKLLPPFDRGLSAFLNRLKEKGLSESTTVLVTGEFGRTPKVNKKGGRDHWARAMCSLLAGAGISKSQVIGATNKKAEEPIDNGFTPDDLAATFFRAMGINPKTEFQANLGRPITLVRDGNPIPKALS